MRKSIIVLAAALLAGTVANASTADARGLRIGLGFGVPFSPAFGRVAGPDPSILERAERRRVQNLRANDGAAHERRQAAKARAEKLAVAKEAQREAGAAKKQSQLAKAAIVVPAVAPVAAAAIPAEERSLEVAQEQQRAKAELLLKSLSTSSPQAGPSTAAVTSAPPRVAVAPIVEREPVPAPVVTPIAAPSASAPAKATMSGDCKRFIPGAGVTISVPCSE